MREVCSEVEGQGMVERVTMERKRRRKEKSKSKRAIDREERLAVRRQ